MNIKRMLLLIVVGLSAIFLYQKWSEYSAEKQLEEDKRSVPRDASTAGMMWAGALKSCLSIGIRDVNACADYKGALIQEEAAPVMAKYAVGLKDSYFKNCRRFYADEYCSGLINRAAALSYNSKD